MIPNSLLMLTKKIRQNKAIRLQTGKKVGNAEIDENAEAEKTNMMLIYNQYLTLIISIEY